MEVQDEMQVMTGDDDDVLIPSFSIGPLRWRNLGAAGLSEASAAASAAAAIITRLLHS